jgi:hypothetical protein
MESDINLVAMKQFYLICPPYAWTIFLSLFNTESTRWLIHSILNEFQIWMVKSIKSSIVFDLKSSTSCFRIIHRFSMWLISVDPGPIFETIGHRLQVINCVRCSVTCCTILHVYPPILSILIIHVMDDRRLVHKIINIRLGKVASYIDANKSVICNFWNPAKNNYLFW